MQIVRNFSKLDHPVALTIGNFDGVHLGHVTILNQLKQHAQAFNLKTAVILFEPQPQEFFQGSNAPGRLMRLSEKLRVLKSYQIDFVVCLKFDQTLACLAATDFIEQILLQQCRAHYLLIGSDFRFGYQRTGDVDLLKSYQALRVETIAEVLFEHERVSSTRIRFLLQQGDFLQASKLLGRSYCMSGRVEKGAQLGRELGFPTINIDPHRIAVPLSGVFAVKVHGLDQIYFGAANLGTRPAVQGSKILLEVYLFDFDRNIYGKTVSVEFIKKIRDEENFPSLEALKKQIAEDVKQIQLYFEL